MPSYYGNKPYSAPAPRSIPTYTDDLEQGVLLANWQNQISNSIQNVAPQATPLNFAITNGTNQLALTWSPVAGSDGYEILKSPSGSFTTDLQIIPVKNANQNSYVDSTVNGGQKSFYRIRTTSGTKQNPQSQRGPESGVVSHIAILSSDTTTKSTTKLDQFTTDASRAGARRGNYGAFKVAGTGVPSRVTGVGQRMGNTSGASGPAAGTKSSGVRSISPTGSVASSSSPSGSSPSGGGSSALPGGNQGSIQYNAGGIFGGSAATVDAAGDISALTITTTTATTTALIATTVTATTATLVSVGDHSGNLLQFQGASGLQMSAASSGANPGAVLALYSALTPPASFVLANGANTAYVESDSPSTSNLFIAWNSTNSLIGTSGLLASNAKFTAPAATITTLTATTATVQTLVAPAAIITAATITTATITTMVSTTATVTSSLHTGSLAVTSTVYDSLGFPGTSAQVYTVSTTGLPQWETFSALTNPMTTTGDMIYESAALSATRLPVGSNNQVLTVIGGLPTWQNAGAGSLLLSVLTTSASYKPLSTDQLILFNGNVAVTATLNSALSTGTHYSIKNTSTVANVFIVTTSGVVDYQSNVELTALDSIDVAFDGTNWWIT